MSSSTDGEYWAAPGLPSVFKHKLLSSYIPSFGGMTGSRNKRVVYLDGYAGEGRYEDGTEASAEIAMRVALDHQRQRSVQWSCFFVEQEAVSFARLSTVAESYRGQGVRALVHRGDVSGVLPEVVAAATGEPLFLFLDPCGLCLPFDQLVEVLAHQRPKLAWPPTELLMNFSMMAVRRLGGNARSSKGLEASSRRFDAVCGGTWWREYFTGGDRAEAAAKAGVPVDEAVAREYAKRLGRATGMFVRSVPVYKAPHHTAAVYHLVFATRSQHGLWVFGDAVARARDAWWDTLDLMDGALFSMRPDPTQLEAEAVPAIARNLEALLQKGRPVKLVDHTLELFGIYYGQVKEPVARKAVKHLHQQGGTTTTGQGPKPRNLIVQPPSAWPRTA